MTLVSAAVLAVLHEARTNANAANDATVS